MRNNRIIAWLMALVLCVLMLSSFSFLALDSHHKQHPHDTNCGICLVLQVCVKTLHRIAFASTFFSLFGMAIPFMVRYMIAPLITHIQNITLISLKIRLTI